MHQQKRAPFFASVSALACLTLAACGGSEALDSEAPEETGSGSSGSETLVVGSANFPENVLLAEIYAGALNAEGVDAEVRANIGSRETYLPGMQDGSLDVFPEYTGVLRQFYNPEAAATDPEGVYQELVEALPEDLKVLDYAEAQDKDAVVVTKETAAEYSLTSIADLADVGGQIVLGGPPEWKTRQTGVPGLEEVYGVTFKDFIELDAGGPLTLNALLKGRIDAGNLFSTDPNLAANDLVVLEDPESLFAAQNIVPLVTAEAESTVADALNAVSEVLDTQTLGELVSRVVIDKEDPEDVAAEFLADNGLN